MALHTTYGSFNRVVSEELSTTYTRETILKADSDVGAAYYKYTRTRTKQYKYIGMTRAAAVQCANNLNVKYARYICPYVWDNDGKRWEMDVATNDKLEIVQAGHAVPVNVAGDDWEVNVEVSEVITVPFRPISDTQTERLPAPFSEFESNPNLRTNVFRGFTPTGGAVDFDYDEGD